MCYLGEKIGAQDLYESQLAAQEKRVFQFGDSGEIGEAEVNRKTF